MNENLAAHAASLAKESAANVDSLASSPLEKSLDVLDASGSAFSLGGYFQAVAVLFLIIALLWLALWLVKKRGGLAKLGLAHENLAIESRLSLGPKKSLVVVRFLNRRLLLGVTDQRITTLTELDDDDDSDAHTPGNTRKRDFASDLLDADADGGKDAKPSA